MYDRKSFTKTLEAVQDFYENTEIDEAKMGQMVPYHVLNNKVMDHMQMKKKLERHIKRHAGVDTYHDGDDLVHSKTDKTIMTSVGKSMKNFDAIAQHVKKNHTKNESVENVDENIISRMLPGAHGRYMKKLKVAHDHHKMMEKGHLDLEKKIDPSLGNNPKDDADTDRQYEHGKATQEHGRAAEAIRKLAVHAKANKLTGHPTKGAGKEFHTSAIGRSKEAHYDSNNAIKYDERYHDHPHMDHTQKLKKSLGKYHSDDHTHHKSLD